MGLLDPPGITRSSFARPAASPLTERLKDGKQSAVLQVLGDSTGDGLVRWPYLVAQRLATKYPKHNVDYLYWNDANKAYDAIGAGNSSRVQTGTTPSPATVADNTTRADRSDFAGNTSDPNGFAWLNTFGTHGITSNKIVPLSASAVTTLSTQYADHTGSIVVSATASTSPRFYVRFRDSTNCIFVQLNISGTSGANVLLYKVANGVSSNIQNATVTLPLSTSITVSWSCVGNTVSFTVLGQTVSLTLSTSDLVGQPSLGTAPRLGMLGNPGVGLGWTSLQVTNQPPTLTVRSGSTTGQVCSYSQANFSAQVPTRPDLTIVNYGHNEGFQDCRPQYSRLVDQLVSTYPSTAVVASLQNPRAVTDVSYAEGLARKESIAQLAAAEGWGVIDAWSAFVADPSYATNLLKPDGLHPSDAGGSPLWADEVVRYLTPTGVAPFRGASLKPTSLFLPAAYMQSSEGAPTLGLANGWPAWSMVHGSGNQSVIGYLDVPATWELIDVYFLWSTSAASGLTGTTNQTYWQVLLGWLQALPGYMVGTANAGTAPVLAASQVGAVGNNSIPYTQQSTLVTASSGPQRPLGRPLAIQARRAGGDANDTLSTAANLEGVLVKRAV